MPTGGSSGEYKALYTAYSSTYATFRSALHLPFSGYFDDGSAGFQGSNGNFWSSTRRDNSDMYYLFVNSSRVSPARNDGRLIGNSVRCILGS